MIKSRPAILAPLTALNFLSYIDRLVLPAVLASVEKELDLSKTAAGIGATAFLIGYFAAAPFFGARAGGGVSSPTTRSTRPRTGRQADCLGLLREPRRLPPPCGVVIWTNR